MSDLINKDAVSRAGLLKSWEELSPRGRTEFDQVIMTIPALPSAESVQGWIPVSERLPEEDGQYLVFYKGIVIVSNIEIMWYGEPLMPNVDVSGKHFHRSDSEWGDIIYDEIIAWMPLPAPYKGGDAE